MLLVSSFQLFAQEYNPPSNYQLNKKEDFAKYEKEVIKATDWLIKTPLGEEDTKRLYVNKFLMTWLAGSPNVTVELNQKITPISDCADCMLVFLGGYAKYALENDDYENAEKANIAGVESMIEFYKKNKEQLGKVKLMEKYIKAQNKNELPEFVKSRMP